MKSLREIFTRNAEYEMVEQEILDRIINAARQELIGTQLLSLRIGPQSIPGDSINLIRQTANTIRIHKVGEADEIPIEREEFSVFTVTPEKYGRAGFISSEAIEDNKFDIVARDIDEMGYQFGRTLDGLIITDALQGRSTQTDIAGGTAITIDNITEAMRVLEASFYVPGDIVVGTTVTKDLRNIAEFVRADASGVMDPTKRLIGTIYGMRVWVSPTLTATSALVMDRRYGALLAEKRPITVERADDIMRDARKVAATTRWATNLLRTDSVVEITTS